MAPRAKAVFFSRDRHTPRAPVRPTERVVAARLGDAARRVKTVDLVARLLALMCVLVSMVLVLAVADQWLVAGGLPQWLRTLALAGLILGGGLGFLATVLPLVVRRVSPLFAAYTIEQGAPWLKNVLLNFVCLRREQQARSAPPPHAEDAELKQAILLSLEQTAAAQLSRVPGELLVDSAPALRWGYALVAVLAISVGYLILSPKNLFVSVYRVLVPWSPVPPATRVSFVSVEPGSMQIERGMRLDITTEIRGLRSGEPVVLHYSSADGTAVDLTQTMKPVRGNYRFSAPLPEDPHGIQGTLFYWISAGDARTPAFRVEVLPPLTLNATEVTLRFPSYTGGSESTVYGTGDFRAIEGTEATLVVQASEPLRAASIRFPTGPTKSIPLELIDPQTARATFVLQVPPGFFAPIYFQEYEVSGTAQSGRSTQEPAKYRIEILRDLPPEVSILQPAAEQVEISPEAALPIQIRAEDRDFGLSRVEMRMAFEGRFLPSVPIYQTREGSEAPRRFEQTLRFNPSSLGLKHGEQVTLCVAAADNRQPEPNWAESARFSVRIRMPGEPTGPATADPRDGNLQPAPSSAGQRVIAAADNQSEPMEKPTQLPESTPASDSHKQTSSIEREDTSPPEEPAGQKEYRPRESLELSAEPPSRDGESAGNKVPPPQTSAMQGSSARDGGETPSRAEQTTPSSLPSGQPAKATPATPSDDAHAANSPESAGGQAAGPSASASQQAGSPANRSTTPGTSAEDSAEASSPSQSGVQQGLESAQRQTSAATAADGSGSGKSPSDPSPGGGKSRRTAPSEGPSPSPPGKTEETGNLTASAFSYDNARSSSDNAPSAGNRQASLGETAPRQSLPGDSAESPPPTREPVDGILNPGEAFERILDYLRQQISASREAAQSLNLPEDLAQEVFGQLPTGSKIQRAADDARGGLSPFEDPSAQPSPIGNEPQEGGSQPAPSASDPGQKGPRNDRPQTPNPSQKSNLTESSMKQGAPPQSPPPSTPDLQEKTEPTSAARAETGTTQGAATDSDSTNPPLAASKPAQSPPGSSPDSQGAQSPPTSSGDSDRGKVDPSKEGQVDPSKELPAAEEHSASLSPAQRPHEPAGSAVAPSPATPTPAPLQPYQKEGQPPGANQPPPPEERSSAQEAQSPSISRHQSSTRGQTDGDRSGAGGRGGGQQAPQPGAGSPGSHSPSDIGGQTAPSPGGSELAPSPSGTLPSALQAQPSSPKGAPQAGSGPSPQAQTTSTNQGGGASPKEGVANETEIREPNPRESTPENRTGSAAAGNPMRGGTGSSDGSLPPSSAPPIYQGDTPNLEYAEKATMLVLEYLAHQAEYSAAPDPNLLNNLGWTEEDLRRFYQYWARMKEKADRTADPNSPERRQWLQALGSLGIRPGHSSVSGSSPRSPTDRLRQGRYVPPPPEWADPFRAYRSSIAREK